ncbi:MAG: site-2 protease family protein [Phycisphaerales bacterium]
MSWESRDYGSSDGYRASGGAGGRWSSMFGGGGGGWRDFLNWSLTVGRVAGITVRLHLVFILFIATELIRAAFPGEGMTLGFSVAWAGLGLASLFGIVLLHEFGHCFACRWVGGEADDILMWPLGGLAFCRPPHSWWGEFVTVAGGPLVNVVICLTLSPLLIALTGSFQTVFFNLFDPSVGYWALSDGARPSWWLTAIWWTNYTSVVLLLFNLLPMHPLDGSRLGQALLWPRLGYRRSRELGATLGYVGAGILAVFALVTNTLWLLLIAALGAFESWRLRGMLTQERPEYDLGIGEVDYSASLRDEPEPAPRPQTRSRRELKQREREQNEQAEVDRILAKISEVGVDGLTRRERKILERATEKRRGGSVK